MMFVSVMDSSNSAATNGINNFSVRIFDSPVPPGFPLNLSNPQGIRVVSDHAMYVEGNYNIGPYSPKRSVRLGLQRAVSGRRHAPPVTPPSYRYSRSSSAKTSADVGTASGSLTSTKLWNEIISFSGATGFR